MKNAKKLIAAMLCLVMLLSISPVNVFAATNPTSLTGYGSNVGSITVTDVSVDSNSLVTSTNSAGTVYTYNITVPAGTTASPTVKFTRASASNTNMIITQIPPAANVNMIGNSHQTDWPVTISNGVGSLSVFVYGNLAANRNYDTYVFNFAPGNPISISTGDPVYIAWNGTTGTVTPRDGGTIIPSNFTLWVDGASSITVDGATVNASYNDGTNYAFSITTGTASKTIVAVVGGTTYTIVCPAATPATPGGTAPTSVISYLPLGQYASGSSWGSSSGKFAGKTSLESTGVSLGALGGYIEFYYQAGIEDNAANPYGVDFVVYGNAFDGNPEAGAVQVSEDGVTWYELAGSKYYSGNFNYVGNQGATGKFSSAYTGTLNNATITYSQNSSSHILVTLKDEDNAVKIDGKTFIEGNGWWPLASEGYPMAGSHNNTGSNVQVSHSDSTLTFSGITAVQDSNVTADYAFGYADVTPNGSPSNLGAPVNPYATNASGGDGFDLAWAVDSNGDPVKLGRVYYVRVYTAVLDNGTFGETSTEVCGIFTTYGSGGGSASAPDITVDSMTLSELEEWGVSVETTAVSDNQQILTITGLENYQTEFSLEVDGGTYIFMNGVSTDSADIALEDGETLVQIISQSGSAEPFIILVKLSA